jgi:hypothetical protein
MNHWSSTAVTTSLTSHTPISSAIRDRSTRLELEVCICRTFSDLQFNHLGTHERMHISGRPEAFKFIHVQITCTDWWRGPSRDAAVNPMQKHRSFAARAGTPAVGINGLIMNPTSDRLQRSTVLRAPPGASHHLGPLSLANPKPHRHLSAFFRSL